MDVPRLDVPAAARHGARRLHARVVQADADEPIPLMQQLLDNPFILLFLGVMIPMLVYTLWGVIDILTVPLAK